MRKKKRKKENKVIERTEHGARVSLGDNGSQVEMTFFTSSTFPAENLNTGETEACLGNCSFSRVSFLVCT